MSNSCCPNVNMFQFRPIGNEIYVFLQLSRKLFLLHKAPNPGFCLKQVWFSICSAWLRVSFSFLSNTAVHFSPLLDGRFSPHERDQVKYRNTTGISICFGAFFMRSEIQICVTERNNEYIFYFTDVDKFGYFTRPLDTLTQIGSSTSGCKPYIGDLSRSTTYLILFENAKAKCENEMSFKLNVTMAAFSKQRPSSMALKES